MIGLNSLNQSLEYFEIRVDLDFIQSKSKVSFKQLVKVKAKQFAFFKFMDQKENNSKVKDLFYSKQENILQQKTCL